MSQPLRKFVNRSTRYFYTEEDNNYIEFTEKNTRKTVSAKVLNISGSGLALVVSRKICPDLDNIVKFECTLPDGEEFAWEGRVRRILDFKPTESWVTSISDDTIGLKMVGLQFENFSPEQEQMLSKKLDTHFLNATKKEVKQTSFTGLKIAGIVGCIALIIASAYYLIG